MGSVSLSSRLYVYVKWWISVWQISDYSSVLHSIHGFNLAICLRFSLLPPSLLCFYDIRWSHQRSLKNSISSVVLIWIPLPPPPPIFDPDRLRPNDYESALDSCASGNLTLFISSIYLLICLFLTCNIILTMMKSHRSVLQQNTSTRVKAHCLRFPRAAAFVWESTFHDFLVVGAFFRAHEHKTT